jgi:precorrin-2 dehydrogenase/sirohydrochlorin ferrochelatase
MDAFPAFIPLAGRRVVVVGAGETADNKARLFDGSPAQLVRLSLDEALAEGALTGAALVFVAGPEAPAMAVAARARAAGALVNVVDAPALGDFTTPSIVDRGRVVGAVGTDGSSPVLAVRLRQELERMWPAGLGALARVMGEMRRPARDRFPDMAQRRAWLRGLIDGPVAQAALAGREAEALALAQRALAEATSVPQRGALFLITAPETVDAVPLGDARRLGDADCLVVVGAPSTDVVGLARRDAARLPLDPETIDARRRAGESVAVLCTPATLSEASAALRL